MDNTEFHKMVAVLRVERAARALIQTQDATPFNTLAFDVASLELREALHAVDVSRNVGTPTSREIFDAAPKLAELKRNHTPLPKKVI